MTGITYQTRQEKANTANATKSSEGKSYPSRTIVHAKLEMTEPGDLDEQEADSVANTIASGGKISRKISNGGSSSGITVSQQMENQLSRLQGGGHTMPSGLRHMMESGFGQDFSHVRLHTDSQAADMSSSISAKAFTHGNDIYFNRGQFSPNTTEGQRLVAHELTHVVQGSGKVGREAIIHNGVGEKDQDFLQEQIKLLCKIVIEGKRENPNNSLAPYLPWYKTLKNQLETDKFTQENTRKIRQNFNIISRNINARIHLIFAHGSPDFLRYNGQTINSTTELDEIEGIDPSFKDIKGNDFIVLMSCQTGNNFAKELSKKLPNNIIVAPDVDIKPIFINSKGQKEYFSTSSNQGFIHFFFNGNKIENLSFQSFFTGNVDNFSERASKAITYKRERESLANTYKILNTSLQTLIDTNDLDKAMKSWAPLDSRYNK